MKNKGKDSIFAEWSYPTKYLIKEMKSFIKNNIKFILIIVICITCSVLTTFATDYLFNSNEVKYDNTTSGIQAGDVQGAIDELYACASNYAAYNQRLTTVENQIYPVGSIYISVSSTNPSTLFGGTWEAFGSGKTLVGVNTSDTDFDTVEESQGSKTVTLTTDNLPSHTHTVTAKGSVGSHTHTVTAKGSVSSSFTGSSTNTNSTTHTHNTSNGANNGFATFDTATDRNATGVGFVSGTSRYYYAGYSPSISGGGHTHTVTAKGSVSSSFTGSSTNTSSVAPSFTGSSTNTSSAGGGTAISVMNPYITVYMWKRIA